MLIALIGLASSGKNTLIENLVLNYNFIQVNISSTIDTTTTTTTSNNTLHFKSSSLFLDYATRNWRQNFVTRDLKNKSKLIEFAKRPFVIIIGIEAPLVIRYSRTVMSAIQKGVRSVSLEDFVIADDKALYGSPSPPSIASTSTSTNNSSLLPPTTPQKPSSSSSSSSLTPASSPLPSPSRLSSIDSISTSHLGPEPLAPMLRLASQILSNPFKVKEELWNQLNFQSLNESLRPGWDSYFMLLASLASLRSNCMKRRVGAVLVREKRVVSTGYNGTPRGVKNCGEGGCGRCNSHTDGLGTTSSSSKSVNGKVGEQEGTEGLVTAMAMGVGLDECLCLHAEENALLEAGRERVSGGGTEGAVLYCNTCPCLRCTVKIVQCGVTEVVYSLSYSMDVASRKVLEEAGVGLRQIGMPAFPSI